MIMTTSDQIWTVQGYVTNSNDSFVYFRLTNEASMRVGASIKFMREYIGIDGLKKKLRDLKSRIDYYKNFPNDSSIVRRYSEEYVKIEKSISTSRSADRWETSTGIEMKGKIIELYDSTAKATWTRTGKFPHDKPEEGDVIYLTF
jgi:hypothetical protein